MNICDNKAPYWIKGKLYMGNTSKTIYLCLDNDRIVDLKSGVTYPRDSNLSAYTECTDQYCLKKVE